MAENVASIWCIAAASMVVSVLVVIALTGDVRPVQLAVFAIGAGGSALGAGFAAVRVSMWWPLAMILAPVAYLVISVIFWVSAAYYRWSIGSTVQVGPEEGMTLAAASWLPAAIVGAAVYAAARPSRAGEASEGSAALRDGAKALAVALVALPFVLQGVPEVVAPRLFHASAVLICNGEPQLDSLVGQSMAVQWVPSAPYRDVNWDKSTTVAMINGQVLTALEVPPLLPEGYFFHRRYLMEGSRAVDSGESGTRFSHEYQNALFRAITLGSSPLPGTTLRAEIEICTSR